MKVMVDSCKAVVCAGEKRIESGLILTAFLRLLLILCAIYSHSYLSYNYKVYIL